MLRVFIAGHRGMVGSAIVRRLQAGDVDVITRTRAELDLTDQAATLAFLTRERPDSVIIAAAKVGGIHANSTLPAEFIYQNLMIEANLIHGAFNAGVERLLFLGSSCIYPRNAPQPIPEESLLSGTLEPTNEPYAIAKIAGIKMCESYNRQYGTDYRSVMPTNLYGPGDNFGGLNSHVLPALLRRFHEATQNGSEEVVIWGTGTPRREFLHVDDMAAACMFLMTLSREVYAVNTQPMLSHINVGTGQDTLISDLAHTIADITGFRGCIAFDATRPDGTPRRLLDVSRLAKMGWTASIPLKRGIRETYEWFLANQNGF
jgi:GDP-L-fucose synthase